jgi:hypothetical protein
VRELSNPPQSHPVPSPPNPESLPEYLPIQKLTFTFSPLLSLHSFTCCVFVLACCCATCLLSTYIYSMCVLMVTSSGPNRINTTNNPKRFCTANRIKSYLIVSSGKLCVLVVKVGERGNQVPIYSSIHQSPFAPYFVLRLIINALGKYLYCNVFLFRIVCISLLPLHKLLPI